MKISSITGPRCSEGSRKLRFPHYVTMAQVGGRVVSLTNWPLLHPGNTPGTHFSGIFIDIKSFRSHYGPGVDSASNRNEYQEHFLGVKAAGA